MAGSHSPPLLTVMWPRAHSIFHSTFHISLHCPYSISVHISQEKIFYLKLSLAKKSWRKRGYFQSVSISFSTLVLCSISILLVNQIFIWISLVNQIFIWISLVNQIFDVSSNLNPWVKPSKESYSLYSYNFNESFVTLILLCLTV